MSTVIPLFISLYAIVPVTQVLPIPGSPVTRTNQLGKLLRSISNSLPSRSLPR